MQKKVVEINVENNLESIGSKNKSVKKSKAQNEVESFGIVEINNTSSKRRVKNQKDKGYEKNVVSALKKGVKKNLNKVEDYLNFDFRSKANKQENKVEETSLKVEKRATKTAVSKSTEEKINAVIAAMGLKTAQIEASEEIITNKVDGETKTFKIEAEDNRQVINAVEACDRFVFDEAAERIMSIARIGHLFD